MVSTLDGAAQHDGRSQPISCAADMRIFGTLRALADVVIAGAETVRQEGYRPARAREAFAARRAAAGQGPAPAVAVVSGSLDLDFSLPLFTEPLVPTLVVTGSGAPADRIAAARKADADVVIAGEGARVDPARVVRELADRGLRRQLTEGGPRLLGQFVAAGVLDELCLTLSPMLTAGDAQRIAGGPGSPCRNVSPWRRCWRRTGSSSAATGGEPDGRPGGRAGDSPPEGNLDTASSVRGHLAELLVPVSSGWAHLPLQSPWKHGEGWFQQTTVDGRAGCRRDAEAEGRLSCSQAF